MKIRKIAVAVVLGLLMCLALSTGAFAKPAHNACGNCGGCGGCGGFASSTSIAIAGGFGFGGGFGRFGFGFPFFFGGPFGWW
jgi:hypothetical protein